MSFEQILYDVADGIAVITLNRPDRLNAMTLQMGGELRDAVVRASADDAVRVIIVTGAGRGFCPGADAARLSKSAAGVPKEEASRPVAGAIPDGLDLPDGFGAKYAYFTTCPKPIIAAINGAAAGVGMVIALYCDIRFASTEAKFASAFGKRGLVAEYGMAWLLPKLIGPSKALDVLLSSRTILAPEAHAMGLVDHLVSEGSVLDAARAYARDIVEQVSPRSTRVMKEMVYQSTIQDMDTAQASALEKMRSAFASEDFKEGIASWREKRKPNFAGK